MSGQHASGSFYFGGIGYLRRGVEADGKTLPHDVLVPIFEVGSVPERRRIPRLDPVNKMYTITRDGEKQSIRGEVPEELLSTLGRMSDITSFDRFSDEVASKVKTFETYRADGESFVLASNIYVEKPKSNLMFVGIIDASAYSPLHLGAYIGSLRVLRPLQDDWIRKESGKTDVQIGAGILEAKGIPIVKAVTNFSIASDPSPSLASAGDVNRAALKQVYGFPLYHNATYHAPTKRTPDPANPLEAAVGDTSVPQQLPYQTSKKLIKNMEVFGTITYLSALSQVFEKAKVPFNDAAYKAVLQGREGLSGPMAVAWAIIDPQKYMFDPALTEVQREAGPIVRSAFTKALQAANPDYTTGISVVQKDLQTRGKALIDYLDTMDHRVGNVPFKYALKQTLGVKL